MDKFKTKTVKSKNWEGDPLSWLLFVLVIDELSAMFSYALQFGVLYEVPLGHFGKLCQFLYVDDLLVLTTGSKEDLRMVKLILYLCEGMSRLEINF